MKVNCRNSSGSHKYKMGLTGLKSGQGCIPFESSGRKSIFLLFPPFRGGLCSVAHGLLPSLDLCKDPYNYIGPNQIQTI